MARKQGPHGRGARWAVSYSDGAATVARAGRGLFDVSVTRSLPDAGRGRLAHQIRQDVWRALQSHPGFSPVIRVERGEDGLTVTAGGSMARRPFPKALMERQIAQVLDCPRNRMRWLRHAQRAAT